MNDLNTMLRDQARGALQTALDAAVTNGDTEGARKITSDLEKLAVSTAPKALPYGDVEIRAELDKQPWFGIDPKKSAKAVEFGSKMDPKKFASAELFAAAVVKAVDEEFKPAAAAPGEDDEEEPGNDQGEDVLGEKPEKKARRTDGPNDGDANVRAAARRTSGPWVKITDAPTEVQKEINRTADKFAPKTKEGRASYVTKALDAHYTQHQRTKEKK